MATEILMPALSPTMTEGSIARWLKKEGDTVAAGDVLAEIETDKATMEVEAVEEGILGRILMQEGAQGVAVNTVIAILIEDGESIPDVLPEQRTLLTPAPKEPQLPTGNAPSLAVQNTPHKKSERIFASPLAKRIALQKNIDLTSIRGSGPNGRIVRADIDAITQAAASQSDIIAPISQPALATQNASKSIPHSSMRKVIARRLSEAKSTIPHFYVSMDVELDALLALRTQLNATSPDEGANAFKLSVNDMLVKAAAVALKRVPAVNAAFTDTAMIIYDDVDISIAVSIHDGLITPIVKKADKKSLKQISQETKDLVKRARAGKLKPEEFQGGTFSISNMGMYGVKEFSAIINPPQAGILAIAAGRKQPVIKGSEIAIATVMTVTLSVDHRVVDGAVAAEWLSAFRSVVESPLSLVI